MNYLEWSKDYEKTADALNSMVQRFKQMRAHCSPGQKKELTDKIMLYRRYRNECLDTANHLLQRHLGEA